MNKIVKFFQEVRVELMKVSWPTPREAINLTLTVLGISLFFAIYVGVIDLGLSEGIKYLSQKGILKSSQVQVDPSGINVDATGNNNVEVESTPTQ